VAYVYELDIAKCKSIAHAYYYYVLVVNAVALCVATSNIWNSLQLFDCISSIIFIVVVSRPTISRWTPNTLNVFLLPYIWFLMTNEHV